MTINFLQQWLNPGGKVGRKSWNAAIDANYNPQQIKVAVQQLQRAGIGVNNAPGQFFHGDSNPMRGIAGMGNPDTGYVNPGNPLGRFQGPGGQLGINAYNAVKASGMYDVSDIPTLARQSGMRLPEGSSKQWDIDMQNKYKEEKLDTTDYYQSGQSHVGTNARGVLSRKDPNAGKTGSTSDLKRKNMLINRSLNV